MNSTAEADHKTGRAGRFAGRWDRLTRVLCGLLAGLGAVLSCAETQAGPLASPGCLDGGEPARVAAVEPTLDLRLSDGRVVRLPGIDAPRVAEGSTADASRAVLTRWLTDRPVTVRTLAAEPDRWNRTVALVFAAPVADPAEESGAGRVSVVEALIEAGLTRARTDPRTAACWRTYQALEQQARAAGLGLWQDGRYAVIAADDRARLLASTGTMAIVEGRIVRIVEGRARTYLSFGTDGKADFAISLDRAAAARFRADNVDVRAWRGRPLRVRGFLDDRFGLQIELTSIDQIEFTDLR